MPEVILKHPETGDHFIVGNAGEKALLESRGYALVPSPKDEPAPATKVEPTLPEIAPSSPATEKSTRQGSRNAN